MTASDATTAASVLQHKIQNRSARVGVVGLGYVGLPLAVEFARAGFSVVGIDVNSDKVTRVNAGDSYVGDIPGATLAGLVGSGKIRATTDLPSDVEAKLKGAVDAFAATFA